ncbi:hypothetical protein NDU88_004215 [Pleurodeles waltl]|uniref:Uncharacterized protein n=1 Tax=Pleurodeles waltl TaxID=8319 RepID=A0AAV7W8C8_PLEWA|nr:hypothetical protein NDU88_004215 [Pleurodeles waltl]
MALDLGLSHGARLQRWPGAGVPGDVRFPVEVAVSGRSRRRICHGDTKLAETHALEAPAGAEAPRRCGAAPTVRLEYGAWSRGAQRRQRPEDKGLGEAFITVLPGRLTCY